MPRSRLAEVAGLFTRLGFTAFGGPAAHVALMEDEVVRRRGWLDRQHFLDLIAAINFIPGPNSTQLAIQLGFLRAGYPGLIVAGFCFIVPAVLIILPLAWLYVHFAAIDPHPAVLEALKAINACVVAIVAAALWRFAATGIRDRFTAVVFVAVAVVGFHGQSELVLLALAAVAGAIWYGRPKMAPSTLPLLVPLAGQLAAEPRYLKLALFFLKVGATLFGSGYVLISYLQTGLVDDYHWMTRRQLLDAIAVGQITPGPLLTTATFIGYFLGDAKFGGGVAGGIGGALLATVAIFLPSFVFVAILGPLLPRIRNNPLARGTLNGVNAAVVALIFVVLARLGAAALADIGSALITAATLIALLLWNVNSTWLILGAAAVGAVRQLLHPHF